ncbi:hypothetical protein [Breznakia pachnodae]|uniref:Membrane protein n=1 Tax=Breznakia pachnodae TaxID=265178 RepID=A0ABU0DZD2_9FIRM|nr:hypothetical protein [Breznakia pachnodae]MDQ0359645.1 putative membrane protein [Breznakia pachnodae]
MIFSRNAEIFEDKKKRKIFYDKKHNQYYLLNAKNERFAIIFKNSVFNAISIGIILGTLLSLDYWIWMILCIAVYVVCLFVFNYQILPALSTVKTKHVDKAESDKDDKSSLFRGIAFFVIGCGLGYCLLTNQVAGVINTAFVGGCIALAVIMGFLQCIGFYRCHRKIAG